MALPHCAVCVCLRVCTSVRGCVRVQTQVSGATTLCVVLSMDKDACTVYLLVHYNLCSEMLVVMLGSSQATMTVLVIQKV